MDSDVAEEDDFAQIVARKQTSLTPEQLEEFESAFRAFDKDGRNKLGLDELVGALRSLGVAEIVRPSSGSASLIQRSRLRSIGATYRTWMI